MEKGKVEWVKVRMDSGHRRLAKAACHCAGFVFTLKAREGHRRGLSGGNDMTKVMIWKCTPAAVRREGKR